MKNSTNNREINQKTLILSRIKANRVASVMLITFLLAVSLLLLSPTRGDSTVPVGGRWSRTLDGQSFATPAAANRMLYVGTNNGVLYVFDGLSGKLKWQFETDYRVPCLPLVGRDGMVYLLLDNGALYVISAFTGELAWKNTEDRVDEYAPSPKLPYYHVFAPALAEKKVFLSTPNGNLHAFDSSTGENLWTFYAKGSYITSPSVYKDIVFIGSEDGKLTALDIKNGQENWSFQTKDTIHYPPTAKDNKVYLGSTDKKLYALDAQTGKLDWSYSAEESIESTPILDENLVYFCSSNGKLCAVDIDRRHLKWRFDAGGSVVTQPVLEEGTIYLGSNDGKLYALNSHNGEILWAYDTEGLLVNPVAISNRLIYVVTNIKVDDSLDIKILAFQKGTYPGTGVVVYGHRESPFVTSLADYFSATAKDAWTLEDRTFDLPEIISWPLGYQFNQAQQALIDLASSTKEQRAYSILLNSLKYFAPGFAACTLLFSFILTPLSFVILLAYLLLGGSLFLIILSTFGPTKMIFLQTNAAEKTKFSFAGTCLKSVSLTFKNYQLILAGAIITTLGILGSLALFNHLSPVPQISLFYAAIFLTWIILLFAGSFSRALNLAFLQKEEINLANLTAAMKHAWSVIFKLFAISFAYLTSGLLICFLLGLGESYNFYFFTTLAILGLTLTTILPIFADGYIVYEKIPPLEAFRKSTALAALNIKLVAIYITFMAIVLGFCSLLVSNLISSTAGIIVSIFIVAFASTYLANIHSILFQELNNNNKGSGLTNLTNFLI